MHLPKHLPLLPRSPPPQPTLQRPRRVATRLIVRQDLSHRPPPLVQPPPVSPPPCRRHPLGQPPQIPPLAGNPDSPCPTAVWRDTEWAREYGVRWWHQCKAFVEGPGDGVAPAYSFIVLNWVCTRTKFDMFLYLLTCRQKSRSGRTLMYLRQLK